MLHFFALHTWFLWDKWSLSGSTELICLLLSQQGEGPFVPSYATGAPLVLTLIHVVVNRSLKMPLAGVAYTRGSHFPHG